MIEVGAFEGHEKPIRLQVSTEVFRCPHPLATMSIEEAADLEIQEMHEKEASDLTSKMTNGRKQCIEVSIVAMWW